MHRASIRVAAIAASLVLVAPSAARACGFHGLLGNGFSAQFPGSIDVAIALRDAADAGVIDPASLAPGKVDLFAYHRAVRRLQKLNDIFAGNDAARMPAFSLLLVERALWSRYATEDGEMSVAVHTEGPETGETVVLTGEAVIVAIEAGKLSWQDAVQRRLVVVVPGRADATKSLMSERGSG